jgi:transposase InsO family protein
MSSNAATAKDPDADPRIVLAMSSWPVRSVALSTRDLTYGCRRIAALLKRERRSDGQAPVNAKRVYRLMKNTASCSSAIPDRRRPREHDGQVATIRSNCRWCSDAPEFTCWNGEVVRLAFALDCQDREVISSVATTAGISGEMIRDMMVRCVELRFGTFRAPQPVQWLSDNGSIFVAHRTIEIAMALNLVPCFAPVESPESNGMAEAFVKGGCDCPFDWGHRPHYFRSTVFRVHPTERSSNAIELVYSCGSGSSPDLHCEIC